MAVATARRQYSSPRMRLTQITIQGLTHPQTHLEASQPGLLLGVNCPLLATMLDPYQDGTGHHEENETLQ